MKNLYEKEKKMWKNILLFNFFYLCIYNNLINFTKMKNNKHVQQIPPSVVTEITNQLNEVKVALESDAVILTPEERHDLLKMGPKTLDFVEKAYTLASQNPSLRPPYLNISEFADDFNDAHNLIAVYNTAKQITEMLSDTILAAGSDAYHASLIFYNSVKVAAEQDVPAGKVVYEELRKRFPRGRRRGFSGDESGDIE